MPEDVHIDLENNVITSVSLRTRMTLSTDRLDVIKENPMVANQPTPHLRFLVASANICLACNPHLTRGNYRTLLQANNQHFSPVLTTKPSYWLISSHTKSPTGQHKEPETVYTVELYHKQRVENTHCREATRTTPFRFSACGIVMIE
jgi:hypothetical protein